MATFAVTLRDGTVEVIDDADAYQQEGQMTTFFAMGNGRRVVDCWSTRLASFRTTEVAIIRLVDNSPRSTPASSGHRAHERQGT